MSDEKCDRDSDAVMETLLANHRRFLAFLEARVGSRHDAEEILQAAFVRSLEKADEIRDTESATAWFYRLLRNAVVDHYRHRAADRRSLEGFARGLSEAEKPIDPDMERVVCECVTDLVSVLKPEYAELIRQVDLEGNEVSATAERLGITAGNARVRLHRARGALKDVVERTCRTCATHGCVDCNCGSTASSAKPACS
jgi:RNA polymerase sigma-70 factor (ECF subfamily)